MSAADEDTELRDLLIHTLESNGVLSKIKAELRASVFLALEEHERAASKPTLPNDKLRHFLGTREGRLAAGLVTEFLQHFHLDFTLAVLQPEASLVPEERAFLARELALPTRGGPLLQELIADHTARAREASPDHTARAREAFQRYDRGHTGEIGREETRELMLELFPGFPRSMLAAYIGEENHTGATGVRLQHFLAMFQRLVALCRTVGGLEIRSDSPSEQSKSGPPAEPVAKLANQDTEELRLDDQEEEEGDSFFEDPIPRPEKTYGWTQEVAKPNGSLSALLQKSLPDEDSPRSFPRDLRSTSEKMPSLHDEDSQRSFPQNPRSTSEKMASLHDKDSQRSVPKNSSEKIASLHDDDSPHSFQRDLRSTSEKMASLADEDSPRSFPRDLRSTSERMASLELGAAHEEDYADDFHSTSQRSDKSEISIGEDLEEELSVDDLTGSDHKLEDFTLDNSISQISDVADYLEDVS